MQKPNLNMTQTFGLVLIISALAALFIPSTWVSAYWDTTHIDTYRGYDIYYFPNINVYGIDVGGEPMDWVHVSSPDAARNKIDLWEDGPITVEAYRDFMIYQLPGWDLFYGEKGDEETAIYVDIVSLKGYIDAEYYPTRISTVHKDSDTYYIYRQGFVETRIWVEYEGEILQYFDKVVAARVYIDDLAEATVEEPTTETPENPEAPAQEESIPSGDEMTPGTVGEAVQQRRSMISAFLGLTGVGCFVYGTGRRRE